MTLEIAEMYYRILYRDYIESGKGLKELLNFRYNIKTRFNLDEEHLSKLEE